MRKSLSIKIAYPTLVISLCALFLFYKYILQTYPSVITSQLMRDFNLTGLELGNLSAAYYYTYTVTQFLVGILLDRFSTRHLTSIAIAICAFGAYGFAQAYHVEYAIVSRALMGVGVSFATVAYMKLASAWFPARYYAVISGLLATAAMAGAVFGEAPLAYAITTFGWRSSISAIGIAGMLLAISFWLLVRDKQATPHSHEPATTTISLRDVIRVFKNKYNWLLTLYSGLAFSPIAVFGGLWGNPFLEQAYHLSQTEAASLVSLVFIGLGLGSPVLGYLSTKLGNRHLLMLCATFCAAIAISIVLYAQPHSLFVLAILLFIFGFSLGSFMLAFTIGKELNSPLLTATVVSMINSSDAILDSITEPLIGKFLDITWSGKIVNGVHYFTTSNYQIALSVLPIYLILAAAITLTLNKTSIKT